MRTLEIPMAELERLAYAQAIADHPEDSYESAEQCSTHSLEFFDRIYTGTPDDIGEIDVRYSQRGYRAIYGFTSTGQLSLYMD